MRLEILDTNFFSRFQGTRMFEWKKVSHKRFKIAFLVAASALAPVTTSAADDGSIAKSSPPVAALFATLEQVGASTGHQVHARFDTIMASFPPPSRVQTREVDADGVECQWFWPARTHYTRKIRAILYVHGGGLFAGSADTHRLIAGSLAKSASADVLAVNYRLAPDAVPREQRDDVLTAYRWLLYSGFKSGNVAVVGDSYGATLAVAAVKRQLESGEPGPSAMVAMSPVLGLDASLDPGSVPNPLWELAKTGNVGGNQKAVVAEASAPTKDFPHLLVQVGAADGLTASTIDWVKRTRDNGADVSLSRWEDMPHQWQLFPDRLEAARRSNQEAADFIMSKFLDKSPN